MIASPRAGQRTCQESWAGGAKGGWCVTAAEACRSGVEAHPRNAVPVAVTAGDKIESLRQWAWADAPRLLGLRLTPQDRAGWHHPLSIVKARGMLRCSWCGHQKSPGPSTLRCPGPVVNQRLASPLDQATSGARRRRCSIIASTQATRERALPPVAGSISGTPLT